MNIGDLIIIYLAAGAPFAVFGAYRSRARRPRKAAAAVATLVLWPISAYNAAKTSFSASMLDARQKIAIIRKEAEAELFLSTSRERIFEMREIFDRYTGLAFAAHADITPGTASIVEISDHPDRALAEACLARTHSARIQHHLVAARTEFATAVAARHSRYLDQLIHRIADIVADPELRIAYSSAAVEPATVETVSTRQSVHVSPAAP